MSRYQQFCLVLRLAYALGAGFWAVGAVQAEEKRIATQAPEISQGVEPSPQREEAKEATKDSGETVKQWLETHPGEKVYAVVLGVTMHRDHRLLNLRVSRVTDPRSENTQPLEVEIPQPFLDRCRVYIEEGPFKPNIDHGMPAEFFTYVYYLPAYPEAVVSKLDQSMAEVTGKPAKDFQPEPQMPAIPDIQSPDRRPGGIPGGL